MVVCDSQGPHAMTTTDPLSLAETKRLAADADTVLLRATRPADLETPIGAFLRLDDGGPSYLLESVEGGERVGRYSFLGDRSAAPARGPRRPGADPDPPGDRAGLRAGPADRGRRGPGPPGRHPRVRAAPPGPPGRRDAAVHRRRGRCPRLRRRLRVRADGPVAGARSRWPSRWPPSSRPTSSSCSTT